MSTNFKKAFALISRHEGSEAFTNDPDDRGLATKWGVSLRFLRSETQIDGDLDNDNDVDADDIRLITEGFAEDVYFKCWWQRYNYHLIKYSPLAIKLIDLSVTMGQQRVIKCLQRAGLNLGATLTVDGIMGSQTLAIINALDGEAVLKSFMDAAADYYRSLNNPKYIKGWLNRCYDTDGIY